MEKKTIVARAEVVLGKEQAFIKEAQKLVEATRAEEGNVSYNLFQNPLSPNSFLFYEEYKDQAAVQVHASSAHFNAFGAAIEDMLASELIIETF